MDEMTFHFIFSVTFIRTKVALIFLNFHVLFSDMHGQCIVPSDTSSTKRADPHLGLSRHLSIRIVNVFLVQDDFKVCVRFIIAEVTSKITNFLMNPSNVKINFSSFCKMLETDGTLVAEIMFGLIRIQF